MDGSNAAAAVKTIVSAEDSGVRQVWMTQSPFWPDALTTFAARLTELLEAGLDELMVSLVPTLGAGDSDNDEQARLAHLIGRL